MTCQAAHLLLADVFDAIFHVLGTGCAWRYLPANVPPLYTPTSGDVTQRAEECAQVFDQQVRFFERGEMSTAWHLGPTVQGEEALAQLPRRLVHVLGEEGDGARHLNAPGRERVVGWVVRETIGVIRAERRVDRPGQPVKADVGKQLVLLE